MIRRVLVRRFALGTASLAVALAAQAQGRGATRAPATRLDAYTTQALAK